MRKMKACLGTALLALALPAAAAEILARAGSETVTRGEFEDAAAQEAKKQGHALGHEERLALLRMMANQRLLVAEARSRKMDRDPALKARLLDTERQALAERLYAEEVASKAAVSLDEAKQYYDRNPGAFDLAEVSQVLVAPKPGEEAAAEKRARQLKERLAKATKKFAQVAKADSDDPLSRPHGGDLGTLRRGMLMPELDAAVFAAKSGEVVGPVKTKFGWHILLVRSLTHLAWEQAGPSLQADMQRVRALQLQQALIDRLSKDRQVVLSEDKL